MDFSRLKRLAVFSGSEQEQRAKRRYLRIGGIALAVLVLILILLPLFINVNSFRPKVESEASAALGRQVTVGNLSLSIFSGSVGAENIAIADDPAFSKSPFVTAKSLKIGVELIPLIFSKQLNVTDITLDEPQIMLLKAANGKWNFSSLGGASTKSEPAKSEGAKPANFSIAKLKVSNGRLSVGKANSAAKPAIYNNVNITVTNFSFTSQFPFELTAQLPGSGDASISGKAGPINAADASKTPLETTVKVSNMNIAGLGMIDPASGIAGIADFDGTLNSNGSQAKLVGLFTGNKMKFSPKGTPAPKTVTIRQSVDLDLDRQSGTISQGDIAIGKAQAHLTGTFQTQGEAEVVNLKLNAPNMPVDELQAMLPAMGVVLPSGSQLKGGTLSAELGITGTLDKLVITGPVRLANSQLANFDLGAKLGALSAFSGKAASSRDTSIQNASLDARVGPEGTQANNINLTVPAIGVVTGAGTISPADALAFKMVANLSGGMAGGLTKVAGISGGQNGIPFAIEGTTSSPKFVPDVGGIAVGLAKGELGNVAKGQPAGGALAKGVGGLLGHKKP
ncbi:AsmA family protein [Alloacidobacterium sp.]|uniref:AsmA family protein n=1 Tax=Alloacidobacterium sp. TaxID=2951999 RepID=UPI002D4CF6EF|nr:AsmA family protein [Alloacidobacterium sp.]HYK35889.1 AsmA family protein [Alloacidobacterium sp.]